MILNQHVNIVLMILRHGCCNSAPRKNVKILGMLTLAANAHTLVDLRMRIIAKKAASVRQISHLAKIVAVINSAEKHLTY